MTETSVAGVRSDVKKVIEASVCSRSVVRDAALSWRSAGRAGGGGSNDGNPVAWLQPSAYGGERRQHPVRATCLIGAGRQGQSILKQFEPATSQLPVSEEELGEVVRADDFDPLPSELLPTDEQQSMVNNYSTTLADVVRENLQAYAFDLNSWDKGEGLTS
ncbi:MAG: hypothetical protein ACPIOQ_56500, partial [Promethearchaeia archaeon]